MIHREILSKNSNEHIFVVITFMHVGNEDFNVHACLGPCVSLRDEDKSCVQYMYM